MRVQARFGSAVSLGGKGMKSRCRLLHASVFALLVAMSPNIGATSFSSDQSDIWNAQGEPGWAIQFVQRGSAIFATIYIYDVSGNPIWYSAALGPTGGSFTWSGDLYAARGPWFGAVPFNPAQVTLRKVGTIKWVAQTVTSGTLTYSVDGVAVTKLLERYLLDYDDFSGHYAGGAHQTVTGCFNPAFNGTAEQAGLLFVAQSGQTISLRFVDASGGSCTYNGTRSQAGQMGSSQGSFACSDGSAGTFSAFESQVNISGFSTRFTLNYSNPPGCQNTGWFGGVRGTTF